MGIQTSGDKPNYGDFINLIQPASAGDPYAHSVSQMGSNAPVGGAAQTDSVGAAVVQNDPLNLQTASKQDPSHIQLNTVDPANPDIPIILALVHLDAQAEVQGKNVFGSTGGVQGKGAASDPDSTEAPSGSNSAEGADQVASDANIQGGGSATPKANAFLAGSAAIHFMTAMQDLMMSMLKNKEQQGKVMLNSSEMIFQMAKDICSQIEEKGKLDESNAMAAAVGAAISLAGTVAGGAISLKGALGKEALKAKLPNETQLAKVQIDAAKIPPSDTALAKYEAHFGKDVNGTLTTGGNGTMMTIENPAQLKQFQALNNKQPFGGGEKLEIGMKVDAGSGLTPAGKAVNLKIVNENRALAGMGPIDNPGAAPSAADVAKIKETRAADNVKVAEENAKIGERNDAKARQATQLGGVLTEIGRSSGDIIKNSAVAANAVDIAYTEQQKTILEALKQLYQQQLTTATETFRNDGDAIGQIIQTVQSVREKLNDAQSAAIRH